MNEFNALERKAGLLNLQGLQTASIHASMFMQLLNARATGNNKLADFYVERLPPDAREAYGAWAAQNPFENPSADPHPFVPKLYEMRGAKEANALMAEAAVRIEQARHAGNISGQYLGNTVLFAAVLFFANAAGKFQQRRVRGAAFIFAVAVFLFAATRVAILPR